jgi:hypothetical protein
VISRAIVARSRGKVLGELGWGMEGVDVEVCGGGPGIEEEVPLGGDSLVFMKLESSGNKLLPDRVLSQPAGYRSRAPKAPRARGRALQAC